MGFEKLPMSDQGASETITALGQLVHDIGLGPTLLLIFAGCLGLGIAWHLPTLVEQVRLAINDWRKHRRKNDAAKRLIEENVKRFRNKQVESAQTHGTMPRKSKRRP